MSTIHQPPLETQPAAENPPAHRPLLIALVGVSAALVGVLIASFLMLGSAHSATNTAKSQLHTTQSQLHTSQGKLAASQTQYAALNGTSLAGTWTGTDTTGWAGTLQISPDHTFTFQASDGSGSATGTWSLVSPGRMLMVEPSNGNSGAIMTYTISGSMMTYTESDVAGVTTTLHKS